MRTNKKKIVLLLLLLIAQIYYGAHKVEALYNGQTASSDCGQSQATYSPNLPGFEYVEEIHIYVPELGADGNVTYSECEGNCLGQNFDNVIYRTTETKYSKSSAGCMPGYFSGCGINGNLAPSEYIGLSKEVYSTSGKYYGEALEIQDNVKFVAGRFIGINAYEEYKKTYFVTINPFCKNITRVCAKEHREHHDGGCMPCGRRCVSCWEGYDIVWYEIYNTYGDCGGDLEWGCNVVDCGGPSISSCRPQAESILSRRISNETKPQPSYEEYNQDVNDIKKGIKINGTPDLYLDGIPDVEPYGTYEIGKPQPSDTGSAIVWQTITIRFHYNFQKACINPKTAEVVYVRKVNSKGELDEEPCPKGYIESPELTTPKGEHIGQYFIPLNMKSTDVLKHNLTPDIYRTRKTSQELCISFINKYEKENQEWKYLLTDKYGTLFDASTTYKEAIKRVSGSGGGCYLIYNSEFKIKQGFYNEVTENGNVYLKGYNFYYRPIDYTNPFPNGIDCDSYWCGLYKKNTNSVEVVDSKNNLTKTYLDKSFDNSTYSIYDIDLNKIRSYNAKNKYTSWDEMNIDGTSSFISGTLNGDYGITRRQCKTFYALGCGPANADWKECQERQNRTVCG